MTVDSIKTRRRSFIASDGVELSYNVWTPEPSNEISALVLVLHGIGFHSAPYSAIVENAQMPNAAFAGLDYRGHGKSGGVRGELPPYRRVLQDIDEWVSLMQCEFPSVPTFALAESMSGPYAVLYAVEFEDKLDGLILVAPAIDLNWRQVFNRDTLSALWRVFRRSSPAIDLAGPRLETAAGNPDYTARRVTDPEAVNSVGFKYIFRIFFAILRLLHRRSLSIRASTLIIHGGMDKILSPRGSRLLMRRIKAPDKRLDVLPDAHHTLLWDSSSPEVLAIIKAWITEHVAASDQT